jgi:RluA family pseudouridine synthase
MQNRIQELWLDEAILSINKPAGLPVLPDGYDPGAPHVVSLLSPRYGLLWIVHRLDRDTSGVLLLARSPQAHQDLNQQFEARLTKKIYRALVKGDPPWQERLVDLPLLPDGDRRHRTIVDPKQGKPSVTRLEVIERFRQYALVEARPETGRTHQIRVHLASQGFPVVADPLYGEGKGIYLSQIKPGFREEAGEERPLLGRLGLHALSIDFLHPTSHSLIHLQAPYPKDFAAALNQLHKNYS